MKGNKVIDNFVLLKVVGSGQFGDVYKAKRIDTEELVAIKTIKLDKFTNMPQLHTLTKNEVEILTKIDNPNIIKFIKMLKTANNIYIVYDYCNGGTLEDILDKRKYLPEKEAFQIFKQILNGCKVLAKMNILHRDLKPSNILFHEGVVKIADFGFCKTLNSASEFTETMVGSPVYMAPEVLRGQAYNMKADIYSLGVVLYEILYGVVPFEDVNIPGLLNKIKEGKLVFHTFNPVSPQTETMLKKMLDQNNSSRIDWEELFAFFALEEKKEGSGSILSSPGEFKPVLTSALSSEFGGPSVSLPSQTIQSTTMVQSQSSTNLNSPQVMNLGLATANIGPGTSNPILASLNLPSTNLTGLATSPLSTNSGNNINNATVPPISNLPSTMIGSGKLTSENILTTLQGGNLKDDKSLIGKYMGECKRLRDKMMFVWRTFHQGTENILNEESHHVNYLLLKKINQITHDILQLFQNKKGAYTQEEFKVIKEQIDYGRTFSLLNNEIMKFDEIFTSYRNILVTNSKKSKDHDFDLNAYDFNPDIFATKLSSFALKAKTSIDTEGGVEDPVKSALLLNLILDCMMLDEVYDNFFELSMPFNNQTYLQQLYAMDKKDLCEFADAKLRHLKIK